MDTEGKVTFQALTSDEYKKLKDELKKAYLEKGKKWLAAKKEAESSGAECTEPKPVKPRYRALDKMSSKANALKLAKKYQAKYEAQQKAKQKEGAEAKTL